MFTQPCFIRKNTPELRKKLEGLGYENRGKVRYYGKSIYIYCEMDIFYTSPCKLKRSDNYIIDCDDNEELFLALAALRDDTDKDQWFTNGTDWAMWREEDSFRGKQITGLEFHYLPSSIDYDSYHKATVKEIIEHFKDR